MVLHTVEVHKMLSQQEVLFFSPPITSRPNLHKFLGTQSVGTQYHSLFRGTTYFKGGPQTPIETMPSASKKLAKLSFSVIVHCPFSVKYVKISVFVHISCYCQFDHTMCHIHQFFDCENAVKIGQK
jgi:hypothetical protein